MVKPRFELFRKNDQTLGVIAKHPGVFRRLQDEFKQYPEDSRYKRGEEVLFWVPEAAQGKLLKILRIKRLPTLLFEELDQMPLSTKAIRPEVIE